VVDETVALMNQLKVPARNEDWIEE